MPEECKTRGAPDQEIEERKKRSQQAIKSTWRNECDEWETCDPIPTSNPHLKRDRANEKE